MHCLKYCKGWTNPSVSGTHPVVSLELIQMYWGFPDRAGAFWQTASFRPEVNVKAGRCRTASLSSLLHSSLICQHDFPRWSEPLRWTNQWAHVCKSHVIWAHVCKSRVISQRQHVTWLFPTPQLPLPPIHSLWHVGERVDEDAPSMPECPHSLFSAPWLVMGLCTEHLSLC